MLYKYLPGTGIAILLAAAPVASASSLVAGDARLWVGVTNRDDQAARFDLRTELYVNDALVAEGEARCVTGLARSPLEAREVSVPFGAVAGPDIAKGDVLVLKVLTRIGTLPDGTHCGGPDDASGLRLYYDAANRPSRFGVAIGAGPSTAYFLRSASGKFRLDTTSPSAALAKKADSGPVSVGGGNAWVPVGTWQRTVVVAKPATLFSGSGLGGSIPDGSGTGVSGAPLLSTVTVPATFAGPVSNIWVEFHGLEHTWAGDLRVRLIHPDGVTSVDLFSRPCRGEGNFIDSSTGGCGSDFVVDNAYSFSDNGTILFNAHPYGGPPGGWQEGPAIPTGTYRPSSNPNPPDSNAFSYYYAPTSLAATFGGMSAVGDWKLEIADWAEFDTGSLGGWTLHVCSGGCPAVATEVGDELFKLTPFDAGIGWDYGYSVAFSGNTAIVGSPSYSGAGSFLAGSAYLLDLTTGRQRALLPPSDDIGRYVRFGLSVAIDGNTALVGALYDRVDVVGPGFSTGSVYVYDVSDPSHPVERPRLIPSDATGEFIWEFGDSVAIRGNLAVVGAPGGGSVISRTPGTVYLFDVTTGVELAKLTASDAAVGDGFGTSVAIDGNRVVVGAPFKDGDTGAAYVYDVSDPRHPVPLSRLAASDGGAGSRFGESAAVSGNRALVGASWFGDGGAAFLFDVTTGHELAKLMASAPPESSFNFGWSVALSGHTALVGAPFADGKTGLSSGAAYLFDVSRPGHPIELMSLTASDAEDADWFGWSVALGADKAVVGATQEFTGAGKAFLYRGRGTRPRPDPSPLQ